MQSPSISTVVQPVIIGTTVVQAASSGAAVSDDVPSSCYDGYSSEEDDAPLKRTLTSTTTSTTTSATTSATTSTTTSATTSAMSGMPVKKL
jgi:hypothetical protein